MKVGMFLNSVGNPAKGACASIVFYVELVLVKSRLAVCGGMNHFFFTILHFLYIFV